MHPAKAPAASRCQALPKGSTFKTGSEKAITWPGGLTLIGHPALKLPIQTGYDHNAQVTYKLGAARHVCGVKVSPGRSPLVVVKPLS